MDVNAAKESARRVLDMLPRDLVSGVARAIGPHALTLQSVMPAVIQELKPHLKAGMMEVGLETLDMDELKQAATQLFLEFAMANSANMVPTHDNANGG